MRCRSVICNPWRGGSMRTRCEQPAGHEGLHSFHTLGAEGGDNEVHWSGQNDRLTEIDQRVSNSG